MNKVFITALALLVAGAIFTKGPSAQQSVIVPATMVSTPIGITAVGTTVAITGVSNQRIYITSWDVISSGTGNVQLISGSGATCATSTATLTGNYNLTAQTGLAKGNGNGAILVVGPSLNLCIAASASTGLQGSFSYAQF